MSQPMSPQSIQTTRAPNAGYVGLPTREGLQGGLDKLILLDSLASHHSIDRQVQRLALHVCRDAGSASDQQVLAVERFCDGIKYRREPFDVFREPLAVAGVTTDSRGQPLEPGGDCDDVVLLALSLLRALSIPCEGQLFCDPATGNAFHIRAVAYLPPGKPQYAYVFDPVFVSEAQWGLQHQGGVPNLDSAKMLPAQTAMARSGRLSGRLSGQGGADAPNSQAQTSPSAATTPLWPLVAVVAGTALWYLSRSKRKKRHRRAA